MTHAVVLESVETLVNSLNLGIERNEIMSYKPYWSVVEASLRGLTMSVAGGMTFEEIDANGHISDRINDGAALLRKSGVVTQDALNALKIILEPFELTAKSLPPDSQKDVMQRVLVAKMAISTLEKYNLHLGDGGLS